MLIVRRGTRQAARRAGGGTAAIKYPPSQTPWQEIQRGIVDELSGHGAEACGEVPEDPRDLWDSAGQPLNLRLVLFWGPPGMRCGLSTPLRRPFGLPCGARFRRGPRETRCAQTHAALIRLKLRSSAAQKGRPARIAYRAPWLCDGCVRLERPQPARSPRRWRRTTHPQLPSGGGRCALGRPLRHRRAAQRYADQGRACLRAAASFARTPRTVSSAGQPRSGR